MAHGADAVGQHPGKRQIGLVARQPQGQRAKGLGHGGAIDDRQHWHAKMPRQVGARGRAVEQTHDPFDKDQICFACGFP